jgi:hypothetical protein
MRNTCLNLFVLIAVLSVILLLPRLVILLVPYASQVVVHNWMLSADTTSLLLLVTFLAIGLNPSFVRTSRSDEGRF